jgi:hypothetical protein
MVIFNFLIVPTLVVMFGSALLLSDQLGDPALSAIVGGII